jgi:hypothetical protein
MRMDIAPPRGDLGLHGGDTIDNRHGQKTPVRRERWRRGFDGGLEPANRTVAHRSTGWAAYLVHDHAV